jgi:asparagine synthase (glutamine-hydrolysing)
VISEDCKVEPHRYYDIYAETSCPDETISYEEAKKRVRELVYDSVKLRMISDVPMGTFLSGGLDSSIVSCVMSQLSKAPINTFSIGYEEKEYDESDRALAVSKHIKSNHTQFTLHYNDVLDSIDDIISYYDEPFSDQSAIPTYMVAKLASQKVKVVLTGDTADEIWGGYGKYNKFKMVCKCAEYPAFARNLLDWGLNLCPKIPQTASKIRSARKMLAYAKLSESDAYYSLNCGGSPDSYRAQMLKGEYYRDVRPVLGERYCTFNHFSNFQKQSVWDIVTQLEGQMLQKVDRACMHVSLENRTPFLDKRLVKLALSLPDSYKMDGYDMKKILWDTFSDILPVEILRLPKKGFGVPVANWLKNELRSDFEKLTSKEFLEEQGIFDYEYVHRLFTDHLTELVSNGQALWNIYVFQKWYNRWVLK